MDPTLLSFPCPSCTTTLSPSGTHTRTVRSPSSRSPLISLIPAVRCPTCHTVFRLVDSKPLPGPGTYPIRTASTLRSLQRRSPSPSPSPAEPSAPKQPDPTASPPLSDIPEDSSLPSAPLQEYADYRDIQAVARRLGVAPLNQPKADLLTAVNDAIAAGTTTIPSTEEE